MEKEDAIGLIRPAVDGRSGRWVELGAGTGTFTKALAAALDSTSTIVAVDKDARAVAALRRLAATDARITAVEGDFTRPEDLAGLADAPFDGVLMANALHFVHDAAGGLRDIARHIRPGGRVVLVEYDRRIGNPWVPHPIPASRLGAVALTAGLDAPEIVGRRPSAFRGEMYCAVMTKP